jgi:hypothetical protein
MGGQIRVDPEVVTYHAARVERAAADAHVAVTAAQSMNVAGGAFGLMCSFLVAPALVTTEAAKHALVSIEDLIGRSATVLRAGVGDFVGYEDHVIDTVRAVQADLDGAAHGSTPNGIAQVMR